MTMVGGLRPIFRAQGAGEELYEFALRARSLEEHLENRVGSGVEEVRVPGNGIEYNGLIVEVPDQKAVDGD